MPVRRIRYLFTCIRVLFGRQQHNYRADSQWSTWVACSAPPCFERTWGFRTLGVRSVSTKPKFGDLKPNVEEKRTRKGTRRLLQSRQRPDTESPTCSAYRCPGLGRRTAYHSNSRAPPYGLCLVCVRKRIGRCQERPYSEYLQSNNVSLTSDVSASQLRFSLAVYLTTWYSS